MTSYAQGTRDSRSRILALLTVVVLSVAFFFVAMSSTPRVSAEDYNFGSENVIKGSVQNPSNRDSEDGAYETLLEGDQYSDTNLSGTTETVTIGTAGGGAFPSALDSDDATRRSYTEADSGGGGSTTYQILRPDGDGSVTTMVEFPTTPTTHYDKIDETTVGGDGDTTYLEGVTNAQENEVSVSDASDPGGSYGIDMTMWHISRGETTQSCTVVWGIEMGGVEYQGGSTTMTSISYANLSYTWTVRPSDSSEWTLSDVNALEMYIRVTDANPDTRTTQMALRITFTPTGSYQLDATVEFEGVTSTSQTTGYKVLCQAYRSSTEDFKVQTWGYVASGWNDKATVQTGSDTDYDFDLTTDERDGTNNKVKLRFVDVTTGGDASQDVVYFDVLKVNRIEKGYALEVEMTASSTNEYGEQRLRIKAYTTAETFRVHVYNWSSSSYDEDKVLITALSNTWHSYDLIVAHHRSGSDEVKIKFVDGTSYTSDTVQDWLYLDVAWVSWIHTDPYFSESGVVPNPVNQGSLVSFYTTYWDVDNEAPSYIRVNIDSVDYDMTKNDSGDTTYYDGCAYKYETTSLSGGTKDYYFKTKDANSPEKTTSTQQVTINRAPTLTVDGVTPPTGNAGETFYFYVTYTDLDNNAPSYIKVVVDSIDYAMSKNDSGDFDYTDGCAYNYPKVMAGGPHTYYFKTADYMSAEVSTTSKNLDVNNPPTLGTFQRTPPDPVYVTTEIVFQAIFTDADGDFPTSIKWREGGGVIQNLTMTETDAGDTNTIDGKNYAVAVYLSHGLHDYDFYASDGMASVSGGSNSITVQNRAPIISTTPTGTTTYRNTFWDYDADATDLDGDTVGWEMSTNATFLSINPSSGLIQGTTSNVVASYSVTYWANDSYGGSDSDFFTLYVVNQVPVITNGPGSDPAAYRNLAWYYDFDATDGDTDTLAWERSGAAWLTINSVNGNLSGTTPDGPGAYPFTVWANDSYGGSDSYFFTLHVNNRIPAITSSGNTTQSEGTYMAYHILASDADGDSLTYELSTNATFLSLSGSWVNGTATPMGWYEVTVWANDSYGGSDEEHWHLVVTNLAPYFTSTPIYSVANNSAYYYDANATDPESDPLLYGLDTDNGYLGIDPATGVVSGTPHLAGTFFIHISVTDGLGTTWQNFTAYVTSAPPSFTTSVVSTWQHGTSYYYDANATDPEGESLYYDLAGNGTAFLTIDHATGVVSGLVPGMGYWWVNVSVADYTNIVWQNETLTALNAKPVFTSTPITAGNIGVLYYYDANATDLNGDTLTYSQTKKPDWAVFDPLSGELTGTPLVAGNFDVELRVFDGLIYEYHNFTIVVPTGGTPPTPPPIPPTEGTDPLRADFSYSYLSLTVTFTSTSYYASPIVSALWDFGDGTKSTAFPVAVHLYAKSGIYTVTLTVVNENGREDSISKVLDIRVNSESRFALSEYTLDFYIGWGWVFSLHYAFLLFGGVGMLGMTFLFKTMRTQRRWVLTIVGSALTIVGLVIAFL